MGSMIETQAEQERTIRLCPCCGKALSRLCSNPECQRPLDASFRTCPFCGTKAGDPKGTDAPICSSVPTEQREASVPAGIRVRTFQGPCFSMGASPDGSLLAACLGTNLYVFETVTGRVAKRLFRDGHSGSNMYSIHFSPDGGRVFAADAWSIMAWDYFSGELLHFAGRDRHDANCCIGSGMAVSPDGRRLLVPGASSMVLWDADQWHEIDRKPYGRPVGATRESESVGVAFCGGGQAVWIENEFTSNKEGTNVVRRWDLAKGTVTNVFTFTSQCTGNPVSWSQDGRVCAVSLGYGVGVYTCPGGKLITEVQSGGAWVSCVRLSASGKTLLLGSDHGDVQVCDVASGQIVWHTQAHSGEVRDLVFLSGETPFASCGAASDESDGARGEVVFWDTRARHCENSGHRMPRAAELPGCPDDPTTRGTLHIETGGSTERSLGEKSDGEEGARLCPYCSGALSKRCPNSKCRRLLDACFALCPSCGTRADAAARPRTEVGASMCPRLIDRTTLEPEGQLTTGGIRIRAFEEPCRCVNADADGTRLVAGIGINVFVFDVDTGRCIRQLTRRSGTSIRSACFTPDGTSVLAADGRSIIAWDLQTGRTLDHSEPNGRLIRASIALSPDGKCLLVPKRDELLLWDIEHWKEIGRVGTQDGADVRDAFVGSCSFLESHRAVWVEHRHIGSKWVADIRQWNVGAESPTTTYSTAPGRLTSPLALSRDGSVVAIPDHKRVIIRCHTNGETISELWGDGAQPRLLQFCPSGARLLSAWSDNSVRLWDLRRKRPLLTWSSSEHTGVVAGISFLEGEGLIASCGLANHQPVGLQGELFIWRVRS